MLRPSRVARRARARSTFPPQEVRGMARGITIIALALVALALPSAAAAQEPAATKSQNVEYLTTLNDPNTVSANFRGNLMYLSTLKGLTIYDIAKPEAPKEVG